jgi:hypothetical protein
MKLARLLVGGALMTGTMSGCLGCGGGVNTIQMELDSAHEQPVWVGIYLLSKEAALDGRPNSDLTNKEVARTFSAADGVIDHDVRPIYPGEPIVFLRQDYDPAVKYILITANFPNPDPCARQKRPIGEEENVNLKVSVVDKCLKIVDLDD